MKNNSKHTYIIPLIFGIIFAVIGIILIISSILTKVPTMSDPAWFGASTSKQTKLGFGIFLMFTGIGLATIVTIGVKKTGESVADFNNLASVRENIINNLYAQHIQNNSTKSCEYCGNEIARNENKCPYCGAKVITKKQ